MSSLLIPTCLAEETELLEAMEWDEEEMAAVLDLCAFHVSGTENVESAISEISSLHKKITSEWGEKVARLAISLFLKRSVQHSKEEMEA